MEECRVAGVVQIAEAVAKAVGAGECTRPGQVAHFALVPVNLTRSAWRLPACGIQEVGGDVDAGHLIAAAGQLDGVASPAAGNIEQFGGRSHTERCSIKSASMRVWSAEVAANHHCTNGPVKNVCHQSAVVLIVRRTSCFRARSSRLPRSGDAEGVGVRCQGVNDELNVFVEVRAQPFDSLIDVGAVDLGGEAFVLELLLDA